MKPSSAKAKGRLFQQFVRDLILKTFKTLEKDDVRSTSMGAGGEDILLSPRARRAFPYSVECKHRKTFSIYSVFDQAKENAGKYEPLGIIRANRREPLVVVSLKHFMELVK